MLLCAEVAREWERQHAWHLCAVPGAAEAPTVVGWLWSPGRHGGAAHSLGGAPTTPRRSPSVRPSTPLRQPHSDLPLLSAAERSSSAWSAVPRVSACSPMPPPPGFGRRDTAVLRGCSRTADFAAGRRFHGESVFLYFRVCMLTMLLISVLFFAACALRQPRNLSTCT